MKPHHQRAVDALVARFEKDPNCLALILVGSLAAGGAKDSSDIDYIRVLTDGEFERLKAARQVHALLTDVCDYGGGYAEGKSVHVQFLKDAARRGSEPARWAFVGARVLFSRVPGLKDIVEAIPVYPKDQKADKIARFYAHLKVWEGYLEYGLKAGDPYVTGMGASKMVLIAARLVLAWNERLYPYHKWLLACVAEAPKKPPGFAAMLRELASRPTVELAAQVRQALDAMMDLERHASDWISRFVIDSEWNWLDGPPPVEDC